MKSPAKLLTIILGILIGIPSIGYAQYDGLDLSANDITALASVGVTPDYVKQIKALGYDDISAHDIVALYSVGVKPNYVKQIKALGYDDISAHDIVALYSVGVKPDYVKQIKALGYDDISAHDIVQFYATGVSPEYIKQMKESGGDLSPGKIQVHVPEIHIPEIDVKIDRALAKQEKARLKRRHRAVAVTVDTDSTEEGFSFLKGGLTLAFLLLLGGALYFLYLRNKQKPTSQPVADIDTRITTFEKRVDDLQDILLSIDHRIDRRLRKT